MISWKVVVGSGAVAAVLSLLTGIISGVSFGTVLFRALMWGVIFSGVGAGISFLISKYLPELFSPSPSEEKAETRPNVDIVLPDENPHTDRENDYEDSSDDTAFEDAGPAVDEGPPRGGSDAPPGVRDNLVEEVEELGGARRPNSTPTGENEEDAEELPDLEGDSDDFPSMTERGSLTSDEVAEITRVSGRSGTVDVLGFQADSEDIAQAIRTALKKDQKG